MKEYPSIPSAGDLLARSAEDYLGRPFVAFDKLDGSNVRAEWDRKRGWHRSAAAGVCSTNRSRCWARPSS